MITTAEVNKAVRSLWQTPDKEGPSLPIVHVRMTTTATAVKRSAQSSSPPPPRSMSTLLKGVSVVPPQSEQSQQSQQPPPKRRMKQNHNDNKSSSFSLRNFLLLVAVFAMLALTWVFYTLSRGATVEDGQEIDRLIHDMEVSSLDLSPLELSQRLQDLKTTMATDRSRKVLMVGMIESLSELAENRPVVNAMASLCWLYEHGDYPDRTGFVHVHVLYKEEKKRTGDDDTTNANGGGGGDANDDDHLVASSLEKELQKWGCRTTIAPEDTLWEGLHGDNLQSFLGDYQHMSRYQRLGKLRSLQRNHILTNKDDEKNEYEIVINVDFDIVHMPPVLSMIHAMDTVVSRDQEANVGSIVCANGIETWNVAQGLFRRSLFYDTMAAIDATGQWAYTKYATDMRQIMMFGQTIFLRDVLRRWRQSSSQQSSQSEQSQLWPMQSCFGGVAIYDFSTWSIPECDYDREKIQLLRKNNNGPSSTATSSTQQQQLRSVQEPPSETLLEQIQRQRWNIDPKYTLTGTTDGDTCEHVMFQQCLYHASRSTTATATIGGSSNEKQRRRRRRTLEIGIQPDLVIKREAAIFQRSEDVTHAVHMIGQMILEVTALAILVFPLVKKYLQYIARDTAAAAVKKSNKHNNKKQQQLRKKNVHEA